jgi:two-component system chemotaxis response regulator CheY
MARIMVVDDAAVMRMSIIQILKEAGHEIVGEASNGREALEMYARLKPDLVTLDVTMPLMDGIDCVRELCRMDPKAKVIICSAMGQQALVLEAIAAGAKDFVVKPFFKDRLLSAIHNHLD